MSRGGRIAAVGAVALGLAGCGVSSQSKTTVRASSATTSRSTGASEPPEVLGVPAVGRFRGRCPAGERTWTLRFVAEPYTASDGLYELAPVRSRRPVQLGPGASMTWRLRPRVFRSRQPADPQSHSPAGTVRSTVPVHVVIEQGTEAQIYRVEVRIALAGAGGESGACAPVGTQVQALTYSTSGAP